MYDLDNPIIRSMIATDEAEDDERRDLAKEAVRAVAFLDKVRAAEDSDQRSAVGSDHWDWIESVVRKLAATA